jgi:hypothetical protein
MAETQDKDEDNQEPTLAGCLLMVVSVALVLGSAVPIIRWCSPDSGEPMPQELAIAPILLGSLCYGIGAAILRILGVPVLRLRNQKKNVFDPQKVNRKHPEQSKR